jgi:hypothetical protein
MRQKLTFISLLLLALFVTTGRNALASTTWYVDGVKGSDGNSGTTAATAYRTIGLAIHYAASGDSIVVAPATYTEHLSIGINLTIVGSNAWTTVIDGGNSNSVVSITSASANVSLSQLTIRNGLGLTHGGGGIYNLGTLTITNTTVSGNSSNDSSTATAGLGGGIYNGRTLTVLDSTVSGNTVTRSRVGAIPLGAGIYNTGKLTVANSTITANQVSDFWPAGAPFGGGIASVSGSVTISSSTLSQNGAIIHTPYGTYATYGGGVYNKAATGVTFQNTVLGSNTLGGNCYGTISSLGYNVSSDTTCTGFTSAGDKNSVNPVLGALQNNGGPTNTIALGTGSPAMNAGNPNGCTDGRGNRLMTDQRGVARPATGACDVGSYQH